MNLLPLTLPYGKVFFCDDIRSEVGNKASLMGIYGSSMTLPANVQFPVPLSRLGVAIYWNEPLEEYSEEITFKVSYMPLDADPESNEGIPLIEVRQNLKAAYAENPPPTHITKYPLLSSRETTSFAILSPFVIPHPGKVRVRVHRVTDVRMLGSIRIEVEPQPS